jgi:putative transposase
MKKMKNYKPIPLENGHYYHIYNRGNNSIDVFFDTDSYYHFLKLYDKYISPIADTLAWCLLKNHFHVLVYIRLNHEIEFDKLEYTTVEKPKSIDSSKQFGHLFNAYTQAINKKFNRTGGLFEKPFERKLVNSERYLKNLIFYINNNPVHHGITDHINNYNWSSYNSVLSDKPTKINRAAILELFGGKESFIEYHFGSNDLSDIKNLIIE